jgi:hypothetical protein
MIFFVLSSQDSVDLALIANVPALILFSFFNCAACDSWFALAHRTTTSSMPDWEHSTMELELKRGGYCTGHCQWHTARSPLKRTLRLAKTGRGSPQNGLEDWQEHRNEERTHLKSFRACILPLNTATVLYEYIVREKMTSTHLLQRSRARNPLCVNYAKNYAWIYVHIIGRYQTARHKYFRIKYAVNLAWGPT